MGRSGLKPWWCAGLLHCEINFWEATVLIHPALGFHLPVAIETAQQTAQCSNTWCGGPKQGHRPLFKACAFVRPISLQETWCAGCASHTVAQMPVSHITMPGLSPGSTWPSASCWCTPWEEGAKMGQVYLRPYNLRGELARIPVPGFWPC